MAEPLWTSAEIAAATGGDPFGEPFDATGVEIDSREIAPGDLFVALRAERDGHAFVPKAIERGAAGTLASRWPVAGSGVLVEDSLSGLRAMAVASRDRATNARRAAITGSVGKTSVTQLVLSGLKLAGAAHGSVRSFNNHIGVPLTLARMPKATERAVFEIGMNHAGEIAPLSSMVAPHVVAITTVEAAHVENFADGEIGVARAKAEIFEGLAPGGVAVLNADNRWAGLLFDAARKVGARSSAVRRKRRRRRSADGLSGRIKARRHRQGPRRGARRALQGQANGGALGTDEPVRAAGHARAGR